MFVPLRRKRLYIYRLLDEIVISLLRPLRYQPFQLIIGHVLISSYQQHDSIFLIYQSFYFGFFSLTLFFPSFFPRCRLLMAEATLSDGGVVNTDQALDKKRRMLTNHSGTKRQAEERFVDLQESDGK